MILNATELSLDFTNPPESGEAFGLPIVRCGRCGRFGLQLDAVIVHACSVEPPDERGFYQLDNSRDSSEWCAR